MKYKSKAVVIDGHRFPSKLEANRYLELKLLLKAGKIQDLELQPTFELQPGFRKNGITYRAITYKADFRYTMNGKTVIEDTKGFKTEVYALKKKLFEYRFPELHIVEVF